MKMKVKIITLFVWIACVQAKKKNSFFVSTN